MESLFFPVDIPNFELIQKQLLLLLPPDYDKRDTPFAFNLSEEVVSKQSPDLVMWIKEKSIVDVLHYRVYVTPPGSRLPPHIDGGGARPTVPFRLNIPITGTKGTRLVFFSTPDNNLKTDIPDSYLSSKRPVDYTQVKPVSSVEITTPHFVNTSVLHGVKNSTTYTRAMFVVTWLIDDVKYREIDEVFQINV